MNVIPSVQNYGAYVFSTSIFGTENLGKIGSSKLPISAYAAFMKQLAAAFAGHPAVVGLDIMNEPRQLSGSPPARTWEQASQAAVEAIRQVSTTLKLWIAGYHTPPSGSYPGLYCFIGNHPEPWIVAENFGYTTHCYYGPGSGYPNSYDEAVALWEFKGY
jgi:endoglucanase